MLALGLAAGMGIALYRLRHRYFPGPALDVMLAGLVAGIVAARGVHVALNWPYFQQHSEEITRFRAGGLDWHGAAAGALLAMWFAARLRRVDFAALLAALTPALALLTLMAWWGCGANHCAYGQEVERLSDYPSPLVWEERDVYNLLAPRYRTQPMGMVLGAGLLAAALTVSRRKWLETPPDGPFWLILAGLCLGMFALGFLRGDYALYAGGLRADQWLDLGLLAACCARLLARRSARPAEHPTADDAGRSRAPS